MAMDYWSKDVMVLVLVRVDNILLYVFSCWCVHKNIVFFPMYPLCE